MGTIDKIVGFGTAAIIAVSPSLGYAANQQLGTEQKQLLILYTPRDLLIPEEFTNESVAIPSSILKKFDELPDYISREIRRCENGDKLYWTLDRRTGFTGDTHYYSKDEKYLGEVRWSDTNHNTRKKPPVNLSEYKCTVVKSFVYKIQEKP